MASASTATASTQGSTTHTTSLGSLRHDRTKAGHLLLRLTVALCGNQFLLGLRQLRLQRLRGTLPLAVRSQRGALALLGGGQASTLAQTGGAGRIAREFGAKVTAAALVWQIGAIAQKIRIWQMQLVGIESLRRGERVTQPTNTATLSALRSLLHQQP